MPGRSWRSLTSFAHGSTWRRANAGHVSLSQLKVMSAIEACRTGRSAGMWRDAQSAATSMSRITAAKTGTARSVRDRRRDWMEARAEDLLPVEYFHVVFTMPAEIAQIAYWNKKAIYGLLFKASAETVMTIAADAKRMGARWV